MLRGFTLLLTFVTFLIDPSSTLAQRERDTFSPGPNFEISGQVHTDGGPVRNARVRLERFSGGIVDEVTADRGGKFRFAGMTRGYYTVIVEAPGFQPSRQAADLQVLFKVFLVFELQQAVVVSQTAPAVIDVRVPVVARDEYAKALVALEARKTKEAIPHLERAISIHPDFFSANLLLGSSYMDLRRWKDAERALQQALKNKPDNAAALISLGEVNWRLKRNAVAESFLLRGLKLDDTNWHGHFTLARLYWDKAEVMKAATSVGRTLQLKPDFAEAHLLAGNVFLRFGEKDRAIVEYEEYMRLAPKGEFAPATSELIRTLRKAVSENKP